MGQVSAGGERGVVITGSSAGLGRALALCYSAPNITLGLIGRNPERLESIASECRARGAEVVIGCLDVRDSAAIQQWVFDFDQHCPIDLLIANAGVASTLQSADDWEGIDRTTGVIDTNLYGALHTVLPVIERMRSRRSGQIAVVSSLAALRGMAISPAYCASKAALMSYCDSVRPILARDHVALSVIMPGFVKTAMSDVFPGNKPYMWSAEKAALHIQHNLARRNVEIAFPFRLAFGMKLLRLLPAKVADAILGRLSYLPREEL
ncbi:SDR family NAD(P)-dependent oxidoreductase [Paraburkholderia panacisoli]|uniref:SDR family NAD(P)-dependent oxidoreductase n=1 Tax=Paraburkholderia panacisoli TaxID=2603818 RepID=A0A5B0GZ43_9BURK|nr:SDR family NAD(P)-dependent oxidoreductase [Paraburkholderia panacisoli]KAA1008217.1 SDR family NAD(P)-dependent oxidoreductase [Paraburkholderia panacisoli]